MDWLDFKEFLKDSFVYLIVILLVILTIVYVFTFQQVVGPSMDNTLNDGNITVLLKSHYKLFDVKRKDIISFTYDEGKYLIKRVIGLPGDKIEIKDNILYINDKEVEEEYLDDDIITKDYKLSDEGYDVIPDNMYFVMGDNRGNSLDSRDKRVGLVNISDINGRVMFRIFPFNKIRMFN